MDVHLTFGSEAGIIPNVMSSKADNCYLVTLTWPLHVLKGTFSRRANTSLLNLQLKQNLKGSRGTLQKRNILMMFVLLDHLLAVVLDFYHRVTPGWEIAH